MGHIVEGEEGFVHDSLRGVPTKRTRRKWWSMRGALSSREGIEIRPCTTYGHIRVRGRGSDDWSSHIDIGASENEAGRKERSTDESGHNFAPVATEGDHT